jgi:hypothetical protein
MNRDSFRQASPCLTCQPRISLRCGHEPFVGGNKRIGAALVNHAAFSATPDTVAGDISHREQVSNQGAILLLSLSAILM